MRKGLVAVCGATALLFAAEAAQAVLGEPADSIAGDTRAFSAVRKAARQQTSFTVHELESDGITVREYVAPSGIVFAVAWNGVAKPDLARLFGSYYGDYTSATKAPARKGAKRVQAVRSDRVVVERWGQMRSMRGRAYIPVLLPTGVRTDEIR